MPWEVLLLTLADEDPKLHFHQAAAGNKKQRGKQAVLSLASKPGVMFKKYPNLEDRSGRCP